MKKLGTVFLLIISIVISASVASGLTYHLMKNQEPVSPKNEIVINGKSKEQNIYQAVAKKATPSVVGIVSTTVNQNIFSGLSQSQSSGTGIIVDSKGYILTNSHVINNGQSLDVRIIFNDGSSSEGKVVWFDRSLDLAVVKTKKSGLTPAELGDSDRVQVGDIAIAIGNPLGLDLQKTVTQGIISGLDRKISSQNSEMSGLLQTDASINSGNSGGPLLNSRGKVIGINTAKSAQGEGIGFAIPINTAKKILETIIQTGSYEKVLLGIRGIDLDYYMASTNKEIKGVKDGVITIEVEGNTAAARAGLRPGDVIVKLGDSNISGMYDLQKALYNYTAGDKTKVDIVRNGKTISLDVEFQKENKNIKNPLNQDGR